MLRPMAPDTDTAVGPPALAGWRAVADSKPLLRTAALSAHSLPAQARDPHSARSADRLLDSAAPHRSAAAEAVVMPSPRRAAASGVAATSAAAVVAAAAAVIANLSGAQPLKLLSTNLSRSA